MDLIKSIHDRYSDMKTPSNHEIKVDTTGNCVTIWYLYWGEYKGVDAHHHFGIAKIEIVTDSLSIGWFKGTEQEPSSHNNYPTIDDAFSAIDKRISSL